MILTIAIVLYLLGIILCYSLISLREQQTSIFDSKSTNILVSTIWPFVVVIAIVSRVVDRL